LIQILLLGSSGIGDTGIHGICDLPIPHSDAPIIPYSNAVDKWLSGVRASPRNPLNR
jgi:hypothetical protein